MQRLLAALFMLAGAAPAFASDCWNNAAGTQTNCGSVMMTLNGSSQSVPLSSSSGFPLPANAAQETGGNLAAILTGTNTLITAVESPIPPQAGTVIVGGVGIDPANNAITLPDPATRVYQDVSSGAKANAAANAAVAATSSTRAYVCGFELTASGANTGLAVDVTLTGVATNLGTMHYVFVFPAGVLVSAPPLIVNFNPCRPSYALNTQNQVALRSRDRKY